MSVVAEAKGLSKHYGAVAALRDVTLAVPEGGIFGVIGANGAGKTTLMTLLQGCETPDAGTATLVGRDAARLRPGERGQLGVQLDRGGLPPNLRCTEVLQLVRGLYGRGDRPALLLEALGLDDAAAQLVRDLSTGQHRRLAVAAAIIGHPRLVFLDEPSLGLDPVGKRALWQVLQGLSERDTTILLTTNVMEEAEALCQRVAFLREGRVEEEGSPRELIDRHARVHRIELEGGIEPALLARLRVAPGVVEVRQGSETTAVISHDPLATLRELTTLDAKSLPRFRWISPRLEDVFHRLEDES